MADQDDNCTSTVEINKESENVDSSDDSVLQDNSVSASNVLTTTTNVSGAGLDSVASDAVSATSSTVATKTVADILQKETAVINSSDDDKGTVSSDVVSTSGVEPVTNNNSDANTASATNKNSEANVAAPNYEFDGECYCYTDKASGITYKFDNDKQEWIIKETQPKNNAVTHTDNESEEEDDDIDEDGNKNRLKFRKQDMSSGVYSFEDDTHVYTDPTDGTKYLWDKEKNAWFPKIDEDFLAQYQMNYGFTDDDAKKSEPQDSKKVETPEEKEELKRKAPAKPSWFEIDEEHNNKVYVNNLPEDITEQEFVDFMQKCGLIMKDPDTGKLKIKLYTVSGSDQLKGDGLCTYIRIESVDLALKVLDGSDLRGHKVSVERAKFQMKGDYNPTLKPKKKRKKDKEKVKKLQEKLLDWRPDMLRGERPKHERVVILKNLFEPSLFEKNVPLILEYQQDLREECAKFGVVRKVVIHDRHPEGVAEVVFADPEEADICVKFLNGRWYSQRQLRAHSWDGKTKYRIVETEEQTKERLAKWNSFLEKGEEKK
ncbi:17S U2 SnRNP complex component HTATSF1 [Bacillus rossius redtenbacheri]|uniref:17S U2 SnRNP complex component HTATSF1 n=1 Tax=Bacillus rossius redtenbacheri TaxID=93214 RepID=UPI002FDDA1BA